MTRKWNADHVVPRARKLSKSDLDLPHRGEDGNLGLACPELASRFSQLCMKVVRQPLLGQ